MKKVKKKSVLYAFSVVFYFGIFVLSCVISTSSVDIPHDCEHSNGSSLVFRLVLVVDISESMESHGRLEKLSHALRSFIDSDIPDGIQLAIVIFSTQAEVLSSLQTIDNKTRAEFIELIPRKTDGETCIGCGLQNGLQLLESCKSGGNVILISDVEDSEPGQDVYYMFDKVKQASVKISTIALGNDAKLDAIEELVLLTHGNVYNFRDEQDASELRTILKDALEFAYHDHLVTDTITSEKHSTLRWNVTEPYELEEYDTGISTTVTNTTLFNLSTGIEEYNTTIDIQLEESGFSSQWIIVVSIVVPIVFFFLFLWCFYLYKPTGKYVLPVYNKYLKVRKENFK